VLGTTGTRVAAGVVAVARGEGATTEAGGAPTTVDDANAAGGVEVSTVGIGETPATTVVGVGLTSVSLPPTNAPHPAPTSMQTTTSAKASKRGMRRIIAPAWRWSPGVGSQNRAGNSKPCEP
jgi:hypothetical protein